MRLALSVLLLATFSHLGFAATVRPCSNEKLTCDLIQKDYSVVQSVSAAWDGFNDDEPSIEPDHCEMRLWLEQDGIIFVVSLTDDDYYASIYNLQRPNLGKMLDGSASMPVVKGRPFYFSRGDQKIKCELN